MKAIICRTYGTPDVLKLEEVEKPTPKDDEVLIKVHAAAVNSGDCRIRGLNVPPGFGLMVRLMFGFSGPRQPILGTVVAGEVESAGKNVSKFKPGDRVMAMDGMKMGCYAEYKTMPEEGAIAMISGQLSFYEAAAIPFGGTTAMHFLKTEGKIKKGDKVLINGASGAVGTAAVQLAKHFGAEVTGVCSAANAALVKSLGADHVIDYTRENFTGNGEKYDLIMDTVGNASFSRVKGSLREGGRLLAIVAGMPEMLQAPLVALTSNKKVIVGTAAERAEDLRLLATLAAEGKYQAVIDRRYPLEEMAEAHRYVDQGHKKGNVIVNVEW